MSAKRKKLVLAIIIIAGVIILGLLIGFGSGYLGSPSTNNGNGNTAANTPNENATANTSNENTTNQLRYPESDPRSNESHSPVRVYLEDNADSEAVNRLLEEIKNTEGVTDVSYVDKATAEAGVADPNNPSNVPHAYIQYRPEKGTDYSVVNASVFAIEGLKDISINDAPAVSGSWTNDGKTKRSGTYEVVEETTTTNSGMKVSGVTFKPIGSNEQETENGGTSE